MSATDSAKPSDDPVLRRLGVKPVINACGIYTDLGGSRLSPGVWAAMEEANRSFIPMPDLLDITGRRIAGLLGAEDARVTPGAAAAIMLGTAACMAGNDGEKSQRLPDTAGMRCEVLIQAGHRYKYDRQVSLTGARLVEVGTANGTRPDQMQDAITERTAMILHPAHLDGRPGTIPLAEISPIAHSRSAPIFADAAYMNYPTDVMGGLLRQGADLVGISAKYFGGPNAGGFVMGRRDLVGAVSNVHFTRYESGSYLKYGRPLKMDRQTIIAVVVALEEWLGADHDQRFAAYRRQVRSLQNRIEGLPGVTLTPACFTMDERFVSEPVNCLAIDVDGKAAGMSAAELARALETGEPGIAAIREGNRIAIVVDVLTDAEVLAIADRLRELLSPGTRA
jgi:D-glucosaminate-6-phosphate ammonia-lyase